MLKNHITNIVQITKGLAVRKTGFIISLEYPFIGATPDGIVECACQSCETRCLEIKCPYSVKDFQNLPKDFFLQGNPIALDRSHQYYY